MGSGCSTNFGLSPGAPEFALASTELRRGKRKETSDAMPVLKNSDALAFSKQISIKAFVMGALGMRNT